MWWVDKQSCHFKAGIPHTSFPTHLWKPARGRGNYGIPQWSVSQVSVGVDGGGRGQAAYWSLVGQSGATILARINANNTILRYILNCWQYPEDYYIATWCTNANTDLTVPRYDYRLEVKESIISMHGNTKASGIFSMWGTSKECMERRLVVFCLCYTESIHNMFTSNNK